ncbi:MAG: hypothetical protein ABJC61_11440 [Acidobacteriota bacterium]
MTAGGDDSEKPRPRRDAWDKAEIVLQPIGGLLTALAVAVLGFWTSSYLRQREGREAALRERMQTSDTNARLYSELTSKREESESALRKDMFTSIISSFLRAGPATPEQKMLNLELLVYNFHESLNLKPLFLHIEREVKTSPNRADYVKRLNQVADAVIKKQMLVIEDGGETFDATIDTRNLTFPGGEASAPFVAKELVVDGIRRNVKLEVLTADPETSELQLRMTIRTVESNRVDTSSTEFWIGHFDFPMIDNTRLPHDQRLAVVLNNYDSKRGAADITAALFPGKYAGLREKPYYDEVLAKLLAANRTAAAETGKTTKKQ